MNKKILVVDDNPVILKLMATLLEKQGHEVQTAKDGYTALNILVNYIPDIIFVDLFMPKIGGDKLCHIIRKMPHLQDAYLIIISAAFSELDMDYENLAADHFIAKGPYPEMAKDILTAIQTSDLPGHIKATDSIVGPVKKYTPRRLTQELILQKYDLEKMLESIDEGIVEVFSGKIIFANKAAIHLLGHTEEELLVKDFIYLIEEKDRPRIGALLGIGAGISGKSPQESIVTINGRKLSIKHFFKKGSASNSIILLADVTGHQLVEHQIRHAEKMEMMAALSNKTHRAFRKQLDGIQGSITELLNENQDGPALQPLNKLRGYVREMIGLNRQIALLSGLNKGNAVKIEKALQTGNETILIVDSDVMINEYHRIMLIDLGYRVVISKSGNDAFNKYKARLHNQYNRIDLVAVAMDLPDVALEDLLRKFLQLKPDIKFLICGEKKAEYINRMPSLPAPYPFIKKPFRLMPLSDKIRNALDQS